MIASAEMPFSWERVFDMKADALTDSALAWASLIFLSIVRASVLVVVVGCLVNLARPKLHQLRLQHGKILIAFIVIYLCWRPWWGGPVSGASHNVLYDMAVTLWRRAHRQRVSTTSSDAAMLYGTSNIDAPLHWPNVPGHGQARHVFVILVESASSLAFPFSSEFCKRFTCQDLAPEFASPAYMTPNYARFLNESIDAHEMLSTSSLSSKSHFASMCGTLPHLKDFSSEHVLPHALPCLPELVQALDDTFVTGRFEAGTDRWDHAREVYDAMGYQDQTSMWTVRASFSELFQLPSWLIIGVSHDDRSEREGCHAAN